MAKIFGLYDRDRNSSQLKKLLEEMYNSFQFGEHEAVISDSLALGRIQIKTVNTKGISQSNDVICCFSGKLFDFYDDAKVLRKKGHKFDLNNESEYILNAYLNHGLDFLIKLNGTFVFVIYDKRKDTIYIVNDRCGIRPVYYYSGNNKLVFSSEIKSVIKDSKISREINWDFWKDFFSYGYSIGNKTPFKHIKSLPNASIITYVKGDISIKKYWDYNKIKVNNSRSVEETITEGSKVLRNVFQRQTKELKKCMVMLSGGYDSRCIASSIKSFTDINIHSLTISKSYPKPRSPDGDMDARYAKKIAEVLDIQYTIIGNIDDLYSKYFIEQVKQLDGLCPEHIWFYPIIEKIGDELINFDGIAADTLMKAGYFIQPEIHRDDDLSNEERLMSYSEEKITEMLHRKMLKLSPIDYRAVLPFFNKSTAVKLITDTKSVYAEIKLLDNYNNKLKIFQLKNRTRNTTPLIPNNIIMRKTFSLMPFCDNEFVEFALSISVDMKVRNNIYKRILQRNFPKIMEIPTTNDPKSFKEHMKKKLVSSKQDWLRYSLGDMSKLLRTIRTEHKKNVANLRLSQNPRDIQYLIRLAKDIEFPDMINKKLLLKQLEYHEKKDIDPTYFLEPILYFAIWYGLFVNKKV